jgi:outer membrane protein OmpA-like peptidoglycan-associated protein
MWKCQPGKWLLWAPIMAGLPFLAAAWLNTESLNHKIANGVNQNLSAVGTDWAKLAFDGRDVNLAGDAPSQEAIDKAAAAIAGTYGVRTVTNATRIVVPVPPVTLLAPTVDSIATNNAKPEIKGTWQAGVATTLAVTLAGKVYNLNKDPELTATGENWVLKPAAPLADGNYDVTAEVTDGISTVAGSTAPAKIVIDTVAPVAAMMTAPSAATPWPYTLTGTWPEGDAVSLVAKVTDKVWTANKDEALKSDGKGNWSFAPVVDLKPGNYDVTLETTDVVGNVTTATLPAAIVIPEPPAAVVAPVPAPIVAREMTVPTIKPAMLMDARPTIEGTWCEVDCAKTLTVVLGEKTYTLGTDQALTSDGKGNWTLKSDLMLKDGSYDIVVESTDPNGKKLATAAGEKIIVDAAAPAAPTVSFYASETSPKSVSGTWAEGDATTLKVSIPKAGLEVTVGDGNKALASDGKGNWSLTVPKFLDPGSYDVVVETADRMGRKSLDQTKFEINVKSPPPPPVVKQVAPTVMSYSGESSPTSISGTWDNINGKGLVVKIPGANISATLDKDEALKAENGTWTLSLAQPLSPGSYNLEVLTMDADGKTTTDQSTAEIYIKAPPPPPPVVEQAAPTVAVFSGENSPMAITGTWDEAHAKTLKVSVPGANLAATKDTDSALVSSNGAWSLKLASPLAPGIYNVVVETIDAAGKVATDGTTAEIYIKAPLAPAAAPQPSPPSPPYDCEGVLAKISAVFPIRFEFDRTRLVSPYDLAVNQYAALLKDPRCMALKIEISGHADYYGPRSFNQSLSELRAQRIVKALTEAGVDAERLSTAGLSETQPLDPEKNIGARRKNRRVEITLKK